MIYVNVNDFIYSRRQNCHVRHSPQIGYFGELNNLHPVLPSLQSLGVYCFSIDTSYSISALLEV